MAIRHIRRYRRVIRTLIKDVLLALAVLSLLLSTTAAAEEPAPAAEARIWSLKLSGGIGPASSDFVVRTLDRATEAGAHLLIIELDTPGGLDKSMRSMIKRIIAAPIPVVTFVFPSGSRAASAGTYILYASHVAAMAPATNLGAASPVQIGAPGMPGAPSPPPTPAPEQSPDDKDADGNRKKPLATDNASTLRRKVMNDAVAYIRGLAELHNRNAEWAEQAVREAASLSADEALRQGVIDLIATDRADLLRQLEGRVVKVQNREYPISTEGLLVRSITPDWRNQFLAVITNPNVAYILMLMGVYGLLLEFYNPGVGVPGVVGAISLLIALYAFQLLPISYIGLALIVLGLVLMSIEALSPSFGIFGVGGAVAFAVGSVMLMDSELPTFRIAIPVIAAFTLVSLLFSVLVLAMALRSRNSAVVSGDAVLVGQPATVIEDFKREGRVSVQGEIWNARCQQPLQSGDIVAIRGVDGLILDVDKTAGESSDIRTEPTSEESSGEQT